MATQCPAIKVQDFNYTNNFALIIKLIPNSYQLMTDKPIDLSKDLTPQITIDNSSVNNLDNYVNTDNLISKYNDIISNIKNNIDNQLQDIFGVIDDPTNTTPNCDPTAENSDSTSETEVQINIQDTQGNIIKNITSTIQENPTITCEVDGITSLVDSFEFPDTFDPLQYQQSDPVVNICNLPDSAIKNQVNYIINQLPDNIENFNSNIQAQVIDAQLKNLFPNLTGNQIESIEDLQNYYSNLQNNVPDINNPLEIKAELGIPLATLDCQTPVILQIINKKVQVMNLYDGTTKNLLEIDKEIDLNVPIIVIFKTNGFLHELYLIIEGDSTIYNAKVFTPKNLSIYYIGVDNEARKNLCGLVMDIQILTYIDNPASAYLSNKYLFTIPNGCLAFYDWHKDRIKRNLVFPLPDLKYPVKMYGDGGTHYHIDLTKNPYHFMSNTYLSEFFCSKFLNQDEWSIWFWFYVDENMPYYNNTGFTDFRTIIFDFINKNSLEYDFGTKIFKFNFANTQVFKPYLINLNTWYFCVLKYKKEDAKLYFNIRRIDIEDLSLTTNFEIPLNEDLKFNLTSMLASFDGWSYNQFFNCKFGTLALFDKYTIPNEEDDNFLKNRIIIQQLNL